ncbi:MAG: hypothetical protein V4596_12505 [Bdellovibrionota bacterium]
MKLQNLLGVIFLAFTVQTLAICQPLWAMTCANLFSPAHRTSLEQVEPITIEITLSNYYKISQELNTSLETVISELSPQTRNQHPNMFNGTGEIFRHAIQNTIQHSSRELERGDYENARTTARVSIFSNENFVFVQIINPKIKEFPRYLEREFSKYDEIEVPDRQRRGNRGLGFALAFLHSDMKPLPEGSTVKWSSSSIEINFTLKIALSR